jgi:hypothetical protein
LSEIENLIKEQFVPFRQRLVEMLRRKHPYILSTVDKILADKKNRIGMQVTENGKVMGEFTFHLDGIDIEKTEAGSLSPELHHPFLGVIRPYVMVERSAIEKVMKDDALFESLTAIANYLPDMTLKFQR